MKKEIKNISDIHHILLETAKVVVAICEQHDIPIFMIGGTMLGAVRHKGFIPWDDDMDFGVYSSDYNRLLDILKTELPNDYRCLTYDSCKMVRIPFAKVEYSRSVIDDNYNFVAGEETMGINIDIFPIFPCKKVSLKLFLIYKLLTLNRLLFIESTKPNWLKRMVRKVLRFCVRVDRVKLLNFILDMSYSLKGKYAGNIFGRWKNRETFPEIIYKELCWFEFEGIRLKGIKNYDVYLRQMYNNYMILPEESQQLVHLDKIYVDVNE